MSDYSYALANIVRNWLTMLLLFLAVTMIAFAALQLVLVGLASAADRADPGNVKAVMTWLHSAGWYSPLVPAFLLLLVVGVGVACGFWLSMPLPFARRIPKKGEKKPKSGPIGVVALGLLTAALIAIIGWLSFNGWIRPDPTAWYWTAGTVIAASVALLTTGACFWRMTRKKRRDLRHEQTQWLSRYGVFLVVVAIIAAIDETAWWLRTGHGTGTQELLKTGLLSSSLASVFSFLVAKIPDWIGLDGSKIRKVLLSNVSYAALFAALVILTAVALLADTVVIKLLWRGGAWWLADKSHLDWSIFIPVMVAITVFALLMASSVKAINLLALTSFYGSRLVRAYLGGANFHRLDAANLNQVIHSLPGDDMSLEHYFTSKTPAPLHLINVTRNRTVGNPKTERVIDVEGDDPLVRESEERPRGRLASYESSLTLYDRHGDRMVFGPFGVRAGAKFFKWEDVQDAPSLGLLCAISGAAVSSGMGRHGSLGTSMAATLANVRLGYWWKEQVRVGAGESASRSLLSGLACLYHELIGQFHTGGHWYLSDGGHSENSGALSLLERGCDFILVVDNGQDPHYRFEDLEIFIRSARTDIGMEVAVVSPREFLPSLGPSKKLFFNGKRGDWRTRAKDPNDEAFALLLRAHDIPGRVNGGWEPVKAYRPWIVWLKPKVFANLPADISTYAQVHPDFPQQSTGNQFFDEAQWESYRRLGFEMGRRLVDDDDHLREFLPVIYLDPKNPASNEEAQLA